MSYFLLKDSIHFVDFVFLFPNFLKLLQFHSKQSKPNSCTVCKTRGLKSSNKLNPSLRIEYKYCHIFGWLSVSIEHIFSQLQILPTLSHLKSQGLNNKRNQPIPRYTTVREFPQHPERALAEFSPLLKVSTSLALFPNLSSFIPAAMISLILSFFGHIKSISRFPSNPDTHTQRRHRRRRTSLSAAPSWTRRRIMSFCCSCSDFGPVR